MPQGEHAGLEGSDLAVLLPADFVEEFSAVANAHCLLGVEGWNRPRVAKCETTTAASSSTCSVPLVVMMMQPWGVLRR
jgi:hypothetical protein